MSEGGERRMLFDIRGRRRHVVKVVYAVLALLMGASLFLVVGPFNLGELAGGGGASEASEVLEERADEIERKLRANPTDENLLLSLARARVAAGNARTEVDPETGSPIATVEARQEFQLASEAWERYLKEADDPSPSGAQLMATTLFGLAEGSGSHEEAEGRLESAATAQQIAARARPTAGLLTTLAAYQFFAGDFGAGDATAKKARASAPKAEAKEVNKQLTQYRQAAESFERRKEQYRKQEQERGKEALQNPLGGLGTSPGVLGQ